MIWVYVAQPYTPFIRSSKHRAGSSS